MCTQFRNHRSNVNYKNMRHATHFPPALQTRPATESVDTFRHIKSEMHVSLPGARPAHKSKQSATLKLYISTKRGIYIKTHANIHNVCNVPIIFEISRFYMYWCLCGAIKLQQCVRLLIDTCMRFNDRTNRHQSDLICGNPIEPARTTCKSSMRVVFNWSFKDKCGCCVCIWYVFSSEPQDGAVWIDVEAVSGNVCRNKTNTQCILYLVSVIDISPLWVY